MRNKMWKRFSKMTEKCYLNMIGAEKDGSCWKQTFDFLKEIILEERRENPGFAARLELLDDETDYEYDILGWLDDCLDETDMRQDYETLLKMCDDLLKMFGWPENTDSDIRFRKASALGSLGRKEEAVKYCREWSGKEPESIVPATALVYAYIDTKEFDEAEKIVRQFIFDGAECLEENDIMYTAASKLYEAMGKRKEKKQIDKAIRKYEEYLEKCLSDFDGDFDDEELPFC